jgi:hypothetical protein
MTTRTLSCLACIPVVAAGVLAGSCAPIRVNSYTGARIDVTAYRTYAWAAGELGATGGPRRLRSPSAV